MRGGGAKTGADRKVIWTIVMLQINNWFRSVWMDQSNLCYCYLPVDCVMTQLNVVSSWL